VSFKVGVVFEERLVGFAEFLNQVLKAVQPEPFQLSEYDTLEKALEDLEKEKTRRRLEGSFRFQWKTHLGCFDETG